jgi:hypothetical protein
MKKIFVLLILLNYLDCFAQYPDWVPLELRNKVFCGDLETSTKMLQGHTAYIKIPYEIYITEDGVQIRMNPGEKFGRNEWGQTIIVGYKYFSITEEPSEYRKKIKLDLSSRNEASDSPLYPDYQLTNVQFNISTYVEGTPLTTDELRKFRNYKNNRPFPSSMTFCIKVPHYDETCGGAQANYIRANSCRKLNTKAELQNAQNQIQNLLAENKYNEAAAYYTTNGINDENLKDMIKSKLISVNNSERVEITLKSVINDFITSSNQTIEKKFQESGMFLVEFDQNGLSTNYEGLRLKPEQIPTKKIEGFEIPLKSIISLSIKKVLETEQEYFEVGIKYSNKVVFFNRETEMFITSQKGYKQMQKDKNIVLLSTDKNYVKSSYPRVCEEKFNREFEKNRIDKIVVIKETTFVNEIPIGQAKYKSDRKTYYPK